MKTCSCLTAHHVQFLEELHGTNSYNLGLQFDAPLNLFYAELEELLKFQHMQNIWWVFDGSVLQALLGAYQARRLATHILGHWPSPTDGIRLDEMYPFSWAKAAQKSGNNQTFTSTRIVVNVFEVTFEHAEVSGKWISKLLWQCYKDV